jgi:hypothetical protein
MTLQSIMTDIVFATAARNASLMLAHSYAAIDTNKRREAVCDALTQSRNIGALQYQLIARMHQITGREIDKDEIDHMLTRHRECMQLEGLL